MSKGQDSIKGGKKKASKTMKEKKAAKNEKKNGKLHPGLLVGSKA